MKFSTFVYRGSSHPRSNDFYLPPLRVVERGGEGSAPCESWLSHSPTLLPGPWAPGTWASPSPAWCVPRPRQSPAAASPASRGTSGTSSPAWRSHCTPRDARRGRRSPGVLNRKERRKIFGLIDSPEHLTKKRKISIFSVFRIRDILRRRRILGSVHSIADPGSDPNPANFLSGFRDDKKMSFLQVFLLIRYLL
jgi:hypothetical protein